MSNEKELPTEEVEAQDTPNLETEKQGEKDAPKAAPPKPPYYEQITTDSQMFLDSLLANTPELDSIAIVFSHKIQSDDLPSAVMRGSHGSEFSVPQLSMLSNQCNRLQVGIVQHISKLLNKIDIVTAQKTQILSALQAKIDECKSQEPESVETPTAQTQQQT